MNTLILTIFIGVTTGVIAPLITGSMLFLIRSLNNLLIDFLYITVFGAMISVYLIWTRSKIVIGPGIDIYASDSIKIRPVDSILKYVSTIATIGLGASGGLVAPLFLIASGVSGFTKSNEKRRILKVSAGAGMVAIYTGAPMASAMLACEYLHETKLEYRELFPSLLSAALAKWFSQFLKIAPVFFNEQLHVEFNVSLTYLFVVILLSLGFGGIGIAMYLFWKFYSSLLKRIKKVFLQFLVSATIMAVMGLIFGNQVLGIGSEKLVDGSLSFSIGKSVASIVTVEGGGSAGLFTPLVLIAKNLGISVSKLGLDKDLSIVLGIASLISSVLNAPLAATLLCVELFGLQALIPAIIASTVSYIAYKRFRLE